MLWRGTVLAFALLAGREAAAQTALPLQMLPEAPPAAAPAAPAVPLQTLPLQTLPAQPESLIGQPVTVQTLPNAEADAAPAPAAPAPLQALPLQTLPEAPAAAAPGPTGLAIRTLPGAAEPAAPGALPAPSAATPHQIPGLPLRTLPAPGAPTGPAGLPPQTLPEAPAPTRQAAAPRPPSTTPAGKSPFSPALTVNNGVITWYDIDQRTALLAALGARGDVRQIAVDQLTEDRLKVQAAKALEIQLPEGAVMTGIEEFAAQRGLAVDDVFQVLAARGIDVQTMKDFVEAGLMWREVVQGRFRQKSMPSETDLDAALAVAANQPVQVLQLSEIALPFGERGEQETIALAERLSRQLGSGASFAAAARQYSRSTTAASGGRMEPIPASQLPPAIRAQVLLLGQGGVTRPIPIGGGLAILRVDSVRFEAPGASDIPDEERRNRMREEIFQQRINTFGQGYLQELERDALIEER